MEPPLLIQKGLRYASIEGVKLIGTPSYIDNKSAKDKWAIEVEIRLILGTKKQTEPFPQSSRWFVVMDHSYPFGNVDIYPAKEGGIKETFHHQDLNSDLSNELPWRTGKICLDEPIQRLGIVAGRYDPIGDYEERIRWHLQRALAWLQAAATNTLVQAGDPFETPYCLVSSINRIVHDESNNSFSIWEDVKTGEWGFVILDSLVGFANTEFAVAYFTRNGILIRSTPKYDESVHILDHSEIKKSIWWLWPSAIVLQPWQAPTNWGELRKIGKEKGVQVDQCLRSMTRVLRAQDVTLLIIGYPIPNRCGEKPSEIHWQTILLPKILPPTDSRKKPPRGFRSYNNWRWWIEKTKIFADKEPIKYLETKNWHPDRLQARSRLSKTLCETKIALIGCGALGSIVAELLTRGGVGEMLFIDPQILEAGNLVRHTLSGLDIDEKKAVALAKRLISASPFTKIKVEGNRFPTEKYEVTSLLEEYNIVIDCTADDEVTHALSLGWWNLEKLFLSASVGYRARRVFLFSHRGQEFPLRAFQNFLEPLLEEERSLWAEDGETLEGAGCWSPLFPARLDDLLLAASSTIKVLEELAEKRKPGTQMVTFEQFADRGFQGLKRVDITDSKDHTE
jgi:hypothetical protein